MEQFDDNRVSTHLLKLAGTIDMTMPRDQAAAVAKNNIENAWLRGGIHAPLLGGGLGALIGGGLGYGLGPDKKKLLSTLAGALLGGTQGALLGGGIGTGYALNKTYQAMNDFNNADF